MSKKTKERLHLIARMFHVPFELVRLDFNEKMRCGARNEKDAVDWIAEDYSEGLAS